MILMILMMIMMMRLVVFSNGRQLLISFFKKYQSTKTTAENMIKDWEMKQVAN